MRLVSGGLLGLGLVATLAGSARAQAKGLEFNGFGGFYAPTEKEGLQGAREAVRRGSIAYGGRITFWGSGALAFEAVGAFSQARVRIVSNGGQFARSAGFLGAAGKLMLNLTPGSKVLGISIGAGPAAIHTFESVPDPDKSNTEIGGVGGLSLRLGVGENVALRGDLEDFFYSGNFGKGKKFTQDFVLSAGLSIRL